jgi:hypothetical protein
LQQAAVPQATRPRQAAMTARPYDDRCSHGSNTDRADNADPSVSARYCLAADNATR